MPAVAFEQVDIVFGANPQAALPLLDAGKSRDEILAETGQVLGVAGASLTIETGEICVLMGLSGSGKSTLLRAVNRLNHPVRGAVLIEDEGRQIDIASCDAKTLRRLRMRRIAMVFQQFALLPWRTVRRERGLRPRAARRAHSGAAADRAGEAGARASGGLGAEARARALGRHAAAGGPRPCLCHRRRHPAHGRAVLGPGPPDPRPAPGRAAGAAGPAAQDHRVRQPRSRRGPEAGLAHRDHGGRADHPGRHAREPS